MKNLRFSIVVPVFNRPGEVEELLNSLNHQTDKDFELVIIEDGSTIPCDHIIERFQNSLDISYYFKANSGPGDSRNFGMQKAKGNYYILFDSDCIIPPNYFETLRKSLQENFVHCYGGPDTAHDSFSDLQKAINYTMTSFFTTGGIRGGQESLSKFQPRSFNMGISKEAFNATGGFGNIHPGEDPDLSLRLWAKGFDTRLIKEVFVYHKRRISFGKFYKQIYKFATARPILNKWHPASKKMIYWFPTFFLLVLLASSILAITCHWLFILPVAFYFTLLFGDALLSTKSIIVAFMSICAVLIQFYAYGWAYLRANLLLQINKGNSIQAIFPEMFF